jgi:hypothetical protein
MNNMAKRTCTLLIAVVAAGLSSAAAAEGFTIRNLFFGGGPSVNSVSNSDNGTGIQAMGGYTFAEVAPKLYIDAEAGYLDTGNMRLRGPQVDQRDKGLWTTGVARYLVVPNIELLARAGVDVGDDDGAMFGIGAGFIASRNLKLRLEFVSRDKGDSLQFNVVFYPWR